MFKKMPFLLLAIIGSVILFQRWIPLPCQSFLYALSLTIKSIMLFLLPFLIFMLLFTTLSKLSKGATQLILVIVLAVCCSNFLSTMLSYQVGHIVYKLDISILLPPEQSGLAPLWTFSLPRWIPNDIAMLSGVLFGILLPLWQPKISHKIARFFEKGIGLLLKLFLGMIPLFITGFIVKFIHDKILQNLVQNYAWIFLLVACSLLIYILFIYCVVSRFRISYFISYLRNMMPAAIGGFSSMSSAAVMPLTLLGTEKNTKDPVLSQLIIPTTVNIHLIGDCFAIPIFAFAVIKSFGVIEPSFSTYLLFSLYFVIAKFSVAAVPGGGILVMLPILENHLGFTSAMSSVIFALYVLFDPVITCFNVLGNGGFAIFLSSLCKKRKTPTSAP